jgi:uncharacterized membrane-anchored protein YjiN (DUF445 family)
MATFIGWTAIILGGAYLAFILSVIIVSKLLRGGLETFIPAFIIGGVAAVAWIVVAVWMSPITISISAA